MVRIKFRGPQERRWCREGRSGQVRSQRASNHPRGAKGGRPDPEGNCGGTQCTRDRYGTRWAVVRAIGREHPWASIGRKESAPRCHRTRLVEMGPSDCRPTVLKNLPTPISPFALKGRRRRRATQGRVLSTGAEAAHRAHSGNPAFRRPSISSFAFEYPPRAINADTVKPGSTSSRCPAASRASASRPRWAKADARQR